jgi:hypothetical protein
VKPRRLAVAAIEPHGDIRRRPAGGEIKNVGGKGGHAAVPLIAVIKEGTSGRPPGP